MLGFHDGVVAAGWPTYEPDVARAAEIVVPVQVNGKVRTRVAVPAETSEDGLRALALSEPNVRAHTAGKEIARVVIVPRKLVNIVVR